MILIPPISRGLSSHSTLLTCRSHVLLEKKRYQRKQPDASHDISDPVIDQPHISSFSEGDEGEAKAQRKITCKINDVRDNLSYRSLGVKIFSHTHTREKIGSLFRNITFY